MGCLSTSPTDISTPAEYYSNCKLADMVYEPLFTNLYNMLRKKNDLQIIKNPQIDEKLFNSQLLFNKGKMTSTDMKMLFNFKNILLIGYQQNAYTQIITEIKKHSSPKLIYILSLPKCKQFLQYFPIFSSIQNKPQTKFVPILGFYEKQLIKGKKKYMVFLHSEKNRNDQVYRKLKIENVVSQEGKDAKKIVQQLGAIGAERVLYLHKPGKTQEQLVQILIQLVSKQYQIQKSSSRKYFSSILPQSKPHQLDSLPKSQQIIQTLPKSSNQSLTETFQSILSQLYKEMSSDQNPKSKIQRSYNLLINLISNIYNNKQSQNFRRVKKSNKQINQSLGKYQYGVKLLEEVGFVNDGGFYVNNTDVKYLKVYRMDLDLAYSKFMQGINN